MKIDDSWYIKPSGITEHNSAGGVVARILGVNIFIGLAKEGDHSGLVLPKGHVDNGENIEDAAKREIIEETGISDLKLITKLGICERLDFEKTSWKITTYFLFKTGQIGGTPTDPHHTEKITWINLNDLDQIFWPEQRKLIQENKDKIISLIK